MTVPDQSLSLEELLLNHTAPQLVPVWDPESKLRDPRSYDLTEIDAMRRELDIQLDINRKDIYNEIATVRANRAKKEADEKAKLEVVAPVI